MFAFNGAQAHRERRRVLAAAYSKSAIAHSRVQGLIKARTTKLVQFIDRQLSDGSASFGFTGPLVIRNLFRALQADILTAFTFSEQLGTTFLDNLKVGPNTIEDLGMEAMDICHDERRDTYFFWESEKPFKHIAHLIDRRCPMAHAKAQAWLARIAQKFEEGEKLDQEGASALFTNRAFNDGVYSRLWRWHDARGRALSFKERASEVMDHIGKSNDCTLTSLTIEQWQDKTRYQPS